MFLFLRNVPRVPAQFRDYNYLLSSNMERQRFYFQQQLRALEEKHRARLGQQQAQVHALSDRVQWLQKREQDLSHATGSLVLFCAD